MKFTKLAVTILGSAMLFCACSVDSNFTSKFNKTPDVVIKVNDREIAGKDFYTDYNRIKDAQMRNVPKEYRDKQTYSALILKEKYTEDVIIRELLNQEFEKRKIQVTNEEIQEKRKFIIDQMGSEEQFNKILKENKISEERLNKDLASEVKMDKLVEQIANVKLSDSEVEKYYNANKAQFTLPERVQVSHILIDTNPETIKRKIVDADKEAKLSSANIDERVKEEVAKKEKVLAEVQQKLAKNPKAFADLAKEYSEDTISAERGGDLGYIQKGQMVKEFSDAAFTQKVGVIGAPVKTQFGTHIILVKDKAKAGVQPLSKVKADLRAFLERQKKVEAVQKFIDGLKSSAKIEYIDETLKPESIKKEIDNEIQKQISKQKQIQEKNKAKEDKKNSKDKEKK